MRSDFLELILERPISQVECSLKVKRAEPVQISLELEDLISIVSFDIFSLLLFFLFPPYHFAVGGQI